MKKVVIIEDEPLAAQKLQRQLHKIEPDYEVIAVLESVEQSIAWLSTNTVDLIFLDIHLSDGLSFGIFDQIEATSPIIFTTAYDQYAIQAFKVNSVDYLLKPVTASDLQQSISKFKQHFEAPLPSPDLSALKAALIGDAQQYQKRFMVYTGEKIRTIQVQEVAYFIAEARTVLLVTHDDKQYIVDYTLDKLEQVLDPEQFFRINRQFIIGINAIDSMLHHTKSRVKIQLNPACSKESIVSTEKAARFKAWLNR